MAIGSLGFASGVIVGAQFFTVGGDPLTLILVRNAGVALLLLTVGCTGRVTITKSLRDVVPSILLGLVFAAQSLAIYYAITLIPVSIASLIEYTAPFQIAIVSWVLFGRALRTGHFALIGLAFLGLALVLGVSGDSGPLAPLGVMLALASSMLMTTKFLLRERVIEVATISLTFWMSASICVVIGLLYGTTDLTPAWPETGQGWTVLGLSPLAYLLGMLGTMAGISLLGAAKASMMANIEPVLILLLAAILLGERLGHMQVLGGGAVLFAVFAFQWLVNKAPSSNRS